MPYARDNSYWYLIKEENIVHTWLPYTGWRVPRRCLVTCNAALSTAVRKAGDPRYYYSVLFTYFHSTLGRDAHAYSNEQHRYVL